MQRLVNVPRVDDPTNIPRFIGQWFKVAFQLGSNAPVGSYQIILDEEHCTEVLFNEAGRVFYSPLYLSYDTLKACPLRISFNDKSVDKTLTIDINSVLQEDDSQTIDFTKQYRMTVEYEISRKAKVNLHIYFQPHLINWSPLSQYSFDLVTDLKMGSRLSLFDKTEYIRVFVYASSTMYQDYITAHPEVKTSPETLQSFQNQGFLVYISQLTEEQTKTAQFPFIEFDSSLLQFAYQPAKAIQQLNTTHTLPSDLPMYIYDNAIYLRFEIRNDADAVLAVTQQSIPHLLQPFASMQRTAARELVPITVHTIGSNRLQQRYIFNHHILNSHDKYSEPSVSNYQRKSHRSSHNRSTRDDQYMQRWQPPENTSEQCQHRVLKTPQINPSIPQTLFDDGTERDKTVAINRYREESTSISHNEDSSIHPSASTTATTMTASLGPDGKPHGPRRKMYGPVELPLSESYPSFFSSDANSPANSKKKVQTGGKSRGTLYVCAFTHYHLPTMQESFHKNNIVLKPSIVLDFYSDPGERKGEMEKTIDIMGNLLSRLEPCLVYRRQAHSLQEVDEYFDDYYQQFGQRHLVDPELTIPRNQLQREFEPGEPYILRSLEPAGVPLTLLNISPPSHLTPARDLTKLPIYQTKWDVLKVALESKYENKPEFQRYEFNNIVKASNNAYPTPHAPCPGLYRRGITCSDNRFHRQIVRDGVPVDEYSCDIYDGRRIHPLLDLNVSTVAQPFADYPLNVEKVIYYCRALRLRLRSSILPLPSDYQQRRTDKLSGKVRKNDNNTGVGGATTVTYIQEFARELIIRTLLDVETKVYQTKMIEYHVVFVGGYRGTPESAAQIHRILREYLSMLPVSFVFVEFNEKTTQREAQGAENMNGGGLLDREGVHLLNETGCITTQAPKFYAMQNHDNLCNPIFTYDRRHLQKLQQEYLYPQRDLIIGVRKSWYLDKSTKVYEYNKVIPVLKRRLALQIKQYLDIQFKSRCTFEIMAQILYPSPPGVLNTFAVQSHPPMKYHTQCAFFQHFFAADEGNQAADTTGSKADRAGNLDERKAHRIASFDEERQHLSSSHNACPHCNVYDTTIDDATDFLFLQSETSSEYFNQALEQKLARYQEVHSTTWYGEEVVGKKNLVHLTHSVDTTDTPPPFMDDIIDTSKFNISLDHIASLATVRDITNNMQWHIDNLSQKIALFRQAQQGA